MKWLLGAARSILGKGVAIPSLKAAFKNPISTTTARSAWGAMKWQVPGVALSLLTPGTPEEKLNAIGLNLLTGYLTLGMNSPWRQALWGIGSGIAPFSGTMLRGVVQGYRGALESRTSLSIPFSHSSVSMDIAYSTLAYSQSRLSDANSTLTGQASFMAARYMSR